MDKKILYLGIDPVNWPEAVVHYPVIRTERCSVCLERWDACTHVIFTSPRAVEYWEAPLGSRAVIAIGKATAKKLRERGVEPLMAEEATQEGVVALLETMDLGGAWVWLPRSRRARNVLPEYCKRQGIALYAFMLYDTVLQRPQPVPNLAEFDEIVFTSPSTVEGFLRVFGSLPKHCKLTAVGPVTLCKLKFLSSYFVKSHLRI